MTSFAYHEYRPSPLLSSYVDCFWTIENNEPDRPHRVLPDGCADILFLNPDDDRHELAMMGVLTKAAVFPLPKGRFAGVCFHPGMSASFARIPGSEIVDSRLPLKDFWRVSADPLAAKLLEARSMQELVSIFESALVAHLTTQRDVQPALTPTQRALNCAGRMQGRVRVDDLARHSGLSSRQFLRLCLELTGLTPKHIFRAMRLRHAAAQILARNGDGLAQVAQDCGYYDQAHFTNEFRALAGLTPTEYGSATD